MLTSAPGGTTLGYDPMLRLHQIVGGGVTTRFAYDGASMIAEYNASNVLQRRFVHGPGMDQPLVWYEGAGTGARRWFHADERGSIIAVSDGDGNLVGTRNRYDEYGNPQGMLMGRFGYTGQAWLPEIGMFYYRARIYNPGLGRFMQADPIGYGAGMNLYAYVLNDPINRTDPSGLEDLTLPTIVVLGPSWRDWWQQYISTQLMLLELRIQQASLTRGDDASNEGADGVGGGEEASSDASNRNRPPTPEERRACATAIAFLSGGITAAIIGDFEVAFAAMGPAAGRGARFGRVFGHPGMAVGGIIGLIMGYATYRADAEARIQQLCRNLG